MYIDTPQEFTGFTNAWRNFDTGSQAITFQVKAGGNVHLILTSVQGSTKEAALAISIGAFNNARSMIRDGVRKSGI